MKTTTSPDHLYHLLEVSPRARPEVIQAAYQTLSEIYAPDQNEGHTRIAKALQDAKDLLLDEQRRQQYDQARTQLEGSIIGDYRVLELIAEGGFGKTYKGEHLLLKTPVCIKHGLHVSPQDEAIIRDEAKAIWDLRHFGIPSIRTLVKLDDGSLALIMSYIPGPTLEMIIEKNKTIEEEHICWIMERIFNILKYLHYHGIIHGDVKPQNIILQPENHTVVLVDYGLSMIRPKKDSKSIGYTPYYAPPEQVAGRVLLPQTDFYGLAMTMIYALGGDLARKSVPDTVSSKLCAYLQRFLVRDVLSRPSWETEDFTDSIIELRKQLFGRRRSEMKPIPGF